MVSLKKPIKKKSTDQVVAILTIFLRYYTILSPLIRLLTTARTASF